MLYDKEFLLALDKVKNKTIYAKITALTFDEQPLQQVEGRVTGGSINIDGNSAVRRTCSLTIIAKDFQYDDFYWGLNTKFNLEIGVENSINNSYPDIIWFKQGIYLITSFSTSRSTSNFTINLSGKDKMCLLNGEIGGSLESSVDFGTIEEEDIYGNWTIRKIPIKDIIMNLVHNYGKEPYGNIIISDLQDYGRELLEYRYDIPLYLYRKTGFDLYDNLTLEGDKVCWYKNTDGNWIETILDALPENCFESLNNLISDEPAQIAFNSTKDIIYHVAKIEYGETAGYRLTDITYAGDLIANVGESISSILDKIVKMLVEFEYFYNVDGQFVFQKKKSTISVMENLDPTVSDDTIIQAILADNDIYTFSGGELVTTFNNTPNLLNLRNDYSIWGERESVSGAAIPVHLRYAIHKKPVQYVSIFVDDSENGRHKTQIDNYNTKYGTVLTGQNSTLYVASNTWERVNNNKVYCDWREIIYQMALDYYKYGFLDDFELLVAEANREVEGKTLYVQGITGYENYYADMQGFWRQLYNPVHEEILIQKDLLSTIKTEIAKLVDSDKLEEQKQLGFLIEKQEKIEGTEDFPGLLETLELEKDNYYIPEFNDSGEYIKNYNEKNCWNKDIFLNSYNLNFWIDFLDTSGILCQYGVSNIGARSKVVNENSIKSISYNSIPNIIYSTYESVSNSTIEYTAYRRIQISSSYDTMFSISSQGKSAQDRLNELMNQHNYCVESATINTIPIYYLEPNSRVSLFDEESNLNGVYLVSKITIPLTYNGTMSLTANRIYEN